MEEELNTTEEEIESPKKSGGLPPWWKIALIVSSVAVVAVMTLVIVALLAFSKNPGLHKVIGHSRDMAACQLQLESVGAALKRYELSNENYPTNIENLYPEYLASRSLLRCPTDKSDPDSGPSSYTYKRPLSKSSDDTVVCTCNRHRVLKNQPPIELQLLKNGKISPKASDTKNQPP